MSSLRAVARRLLLSLLTLVGVTAVLFGLLHAIPGGPLRAAVGEAVGTDPAAVQRAEALLGFDRPPVERYLAWVGGLLVGDLGESWAVAPGRPVGPILLDALANTLLLTGSALAVALFLGGLVGVVSALRPGSWTDAGLGVASFVLGGAPTFWLGMLLIVVFAVELAWLPAGGAQTIGRSDPLDRVRYLVLPVLTLAAVQVPAWGRHVRAALLDVLGREYLRTARATGLGERAVVLRHAFPNALPPLVGLLSLEAASLVAGATVTEAVFSYPGVGRLLLTALRSHDWPLVQAIVLVLAGTVIVVSLAAEAALALLDPRARS